MLDFVHPARVTQEVHFQHSVSIVMPHLFEYLLGFDIHVMVMLWLVTLMSVLVLFVLHTQKSTSQKYRLTVSESYLPRMPTTGSKSLAEAENLHTDTLAFLPDLGLTSLFEPDL